MFRYIIKIVAVIVVSVLSFVSCDLDKSPHEDMPLDGAWVSVNDAVSFRYGMYNSLRYIQGGKYAYTADIQSDLFNESISSANRSGPMHRWTFNSSTYETIDYWANSYEAIKSCNNIIRNIDNIKPEKADDEKILSRIKGEAYLVRAVCYHALLLRFAKDYEPSSAATDLGLPLVEVFNVQDKPARSTLQDTYSFIKNDIVEARKYLTTTTQEANVNYLSVDAIDMFEARVDLYMHNYPSAIALADKIIGKYPLVAEAKDFKEMWSIDMKTSETIFMPFQSVDERVNEMERYYTYSTGNKAFDPDYVPSKWVIDLYDNNDYRKDAYFDNSKITCATTTVTDVYLLSKFPGNPDLQKGEYDRYNMSKTFRSAEAYLIAAESSFKSGNEAKATQYLNNLKSKRNSPAAAGLTGNNLFEEIKKEWLKEFIGEGQRINDLKRWHDGFTRRAPQNTAILLVAGGGTTQSIEADHYKFVWEIPVHDLSSNKDIISNWGNKE